MRRLPLDADPLARRTVVIVRAFLAGKQWNDLRDLGPIPTRPRPARRNIDCRQHWAQGRTGMTIT